MGSELAQNKRVNSLSLASIPIGASRAVSHDDVIFTSHFRSKDQDGSFDRVVHCDTPSAKR